MPVHFAKARLLAFGVASTILLTFAVAPAMGQVKLFHRTQPEYCPPPPCPQPPVQQPAPTTPQAPPSPEPQVPIPPAPAPTTPEPSFPPTIAAATGLDTVAFMKGDQVPIA